VQRLGSPSVSPDGSRVAFESFTDDHNLLETGLDGTVARTLRATPYAEQGVDWAPSGDSYVYVQDPFRTLWIRGRENKNEPSKVSR
jgi:Tol biopolymer transport system component